MSTKISNEHKERVNSILIPYLELKDEQYLLNLPLEKAIELGISETDYQNAITEIEEANSTISQLIKENPEEKYSLVDPQKLIKENLLQTMPSGYLSTNGQEQVSTSFNAPAAATKVRFSCSGGGALIPVYLCVTIALGTTKTKTDWGTAFTWTDIDVDLAASNTTVTIRFSTTDSNGGKCNWQAMA